VERSKKENRRKNLEELLKELVQVGAMAQKMAEDVVIKNIKVKK
jgi:NTP pyrophosphatase (non-canonical NTP hydrolase)